MVNTKKTSNKDKPKESTKTGKVDKSADRSSKGKDKVPETGKKGKDDCAASNKPPSSLNVKESGKAKSKDKRETYEGKYPPNGCLQL